MESNLTINRKILSEPFNVKIKTIESGIEEEVKVNLVETFNIWYGIRVTRIYTFDDDRKYAFICGIKDNQGLMIIWRSTLNLDYNRDREFIVKILLEEIKIGINSNRLNQVLINIDETRFVSHPSMNFFAPISMLIFSG